MDCLEKDVVARMACSISVRSWDDVWFINKGQATPAVAVRIVFE